MPYYVYKITPPKRLEYLDEFDAYRDARVFTRERRGAMGPQAGFSVRMVFAPGRAQAERMLKEVREARPLGEDA